MFEIHARIDSRNRITLPSEVRKRLGVGPSDTIAFELHEDGRIFVRKAVLALESKTAGIAETVPAGPRKP